tara:strand:- start:2649 stop:3491 length:843 start_codon:yes stop_codon:yes gene_type:complete
MPSFKPKDLASIEYHGASGITQHCLDAVARLIHFGEKIYVAKLLTCLDRHNCGDHGLLLTMEHEHFVAIKPGFSSGYNGEGPTGLSTVLRMLQWQGADIEEYDVSPAIMERLNAGCLLSKDVDDLERATPVLPVRYYDYMLGSHRDLQRYFPPTINFGLLDKRLVDLALDFSANPGYAIDSAFKRLEDLIRRRIEMPGESGSKLLTKAFLGEGSILHWGDENPSEQSSKANLFKSVFGAYRNPRAHREVAASDDEAVREFMLVNSLYLLEAAAVARKPNA